MKYSANAKQKLSMMQSGHCLYLLNDLLCKTSASAKFLGKIIGTKKVREAGKWKCIDTETCYYQ